MLSLFPLDVLDEVWDVIESVFEGFLTYSFIQMGKERLYVWFMTHEQDDLHVHMW